MGFKFAMLWLQGMFCLCTRFPQCGSLNLVLGVPAILHKTACYLEGTEEMKPFLLSCKEQTGKRV